jgi:hypothetical protein
MKLPTLLAACVAVSLPCVDAATSFSAVFTWTGTTGDTSSFAYNGTTYEGLTVSNATKVGVTSSSSTSNFRASAWSTGATNGSDTFTGSIDLGDYFEITLTADSGYALDLDGIVFGIGRSATGPRQWQWRSNIDSYTTAIATYTTVNAGLGESSGVLTNPDANSNWTGNELDLAGAAYQGLSTITFRFYGYNAEASTGTGGLQGPLTISGTVVPEPSIVLLGSFGLLGLLRRRRA